MAYNFKILVAEELLEWSRCRENGNPRSVEDLDEIQFADIIGSIAESHHLDRCVDAAFVGTEEIEAERIPIDAIEEPKDSAMPDDAQKRTTMSKICLNGYLCPVIQQANETENPNG